jgi:hypothetical protein
MKFNENPSDVTVFTQNPPRNPSWIAAYSSEGRKERGK